jgi:hypothetical protein
MGRPGIIARVAFVSHGTAEHYCDRLFFKGILLQHLQHDQNR